ncbi:MAG: DUF5677 domain-containing protein [Candidatus Omnitrophica bacterium]|nr:DUF5677 domain-containing protein [Candidatus Omnitrophota bacterium]
MFGFIAKQLYIRGFKKGVREGYKRGKIFGSEKFVKSNSKLLGKYLDFYNKVFNFTIKTNKASFEKYNPPSHLANNSILSRGCLYVIGERAVILHRSVFSLCEDGWVSVTPVILRSLLECFTNSVAIVNKDSEYMAFKYYAHDFLNSLLDQDFDNYTKEFNTKQIDFQLQRLNQQDRDRAEKYKSEFMKNGKPRNYWYKPEYESVGDIFKVCNDKDSEWYKVYKNLSMSIHSSFIGSNIFKDQPDKKDINPREDLESTMLALVSSSRSLLEITNVRQQFEKLNLDSEVNQLIAELLTLNESNKIITPNL